jgi:hypothetical protein
MAHVKEFHRWTIALNVKLLLPPRQSRGASLGRLAYALRLLDQNPYRALTLINDIRIVFAHSLHNVDFHTQEVVQDCQQLLTISETLTEAAGVTKESAAIDIYANFVRVLYGSIRAVAEKLYPREAGSS